MITASDAAAVLGISRFDTANDILYKKCGFEKRFSCESRARMAHGVHYEDEARDVYSAQMGEVVHEVGIIRHPVYPFIGGSPDGITESGKLIEIKCPSGSLRKDIPTYYIPQVQLCMEVLDLEECDYMEYKPDNKMLKIINIKRDREWFSKALPVFKEFWNTVIERRQSPLCEIKDDNQTDPEEEPVF